MGQLRGEPATVSSEIRTTPSERPARWRQAGGVRRGQAANHEPAVAVRTITSVSVVDCGDEHKENESEKEPKEGKAESFQEVHAESEARCGEKNNCKK